MAITVTAAQAGTGTANGIALTVKVLTGQAASPVGMVGNSAAFTTPELAITPAATGSWVYGAVCNLTAATAFTPAGTTTFSQNTADSGNATTYGTFRSTATTTSGTPVALGATAPSVSSGAAGIALCEIKTAGALAENASAPAAVHNFSGTSAVTASFLPPPGSLLVAMACSNGDGVGTHSLTLGVSDTSGLTWTLRSVATVPVSPSGTFQVAAIWTALVPSPAAASPFGAIPGTARLGRSTPGNPAGAATPSPTTPSPFTPPSRPAKGRRAARRGTSRSSPGAPRTAPAPPPTPPAVVNEWAGSYGQGTTFTSITSALQSCVVQLNLDSSVGTGSGTPSPGNWLFVSASWTQDPALANVHVGVNDDIRSWYREYPAAGSEGSTRTAIAYTPNLARVPSCVYVAPDGQVAALTVHVTEVYGLGPWDTVVTGMPYANYAAAAHSLNLALSAPGAPAFFIAAAGGDNISAGQALAPAGWTGLATVSQSNGSNHLADSYLTGAYLASSSSAQSINATASTAEDLSGFLLGVWTTGLNPVPAGQNPDWPPVILEAGFGGGFNTPDSEITWTNISDRLWSWDETTGIKFNLGQLQSTDLNIELDNYDNYLSSTNAESPYYPDVQPGTPLRLRAALGTLGGNVVNRWYVIQRNAAQWGEAIDNALRRYCEVSGTDIWAALSDTPPSFYRSEVYADNPYAWWPLDDQPGTSGVLPTALLNAAVGNANTLNVVLSPNGGVAQQYYSTVGAVGTKLVAPGIAVYSVGQNQGWMFGDPPGSPASLGTGNPVTSTPGSASWTASGQAGTTGSYGFFLSCNDPGFPPLSGGITVEVWWNYLFYASANGFQTSDVGAGNYSPQLQQPYNTPLTIAELATDSGPVCILQLDASGHLNLITYAGSTPASHSVYTASDLRSASWHMATVTLTTTTWQVLLDGGDNADVAGAAAGMTSAWSWLILNGDLGAHGGSPGGTGLVHGGNVSLSHVVIYPCILPYYRLLAHYWAALSGFGQLPAPSGVQITWGADEPAPRPNPGTSYAPDGSSGYRHGGYPVSGGATISAVVAAQAQAGAVTSGPSAWTAEGFVGATTDIGVGDGWVWVGWTGLSSAFEVYTASGVGTESGAALVAGDGDSFNSGYGAGASGAGVAQVSSGSGASPPSAPSAVGDTVGQRIERLMRAGKTTSPNRCIDPAPLLVQAPGTSGGGTQAGASIQAIQASDSGMLAVDNCNNLFYWQRPHLAAQYSSPVWQLGPSTFSGETAYYREIRWITDPQRVWNAIGITPISPTGAALPVITPTNASAVDASQEAFGAQPLAITSWLQSLSEMLSQANWLFANYGTPQRRVEKVKIDAAPDPAAWELIFGVNVGDIITLEDWQIGGGGTVHTYRVTEIERVISRGSHDHAVTGHVVLTCDYEPSSYFS